MIQLLGYCDESVQLVTEYHGFRDGRNIPAVFDSFNVSSTEERALRLSLCIDYVRIVDFLFAKGYYHPDGNSLNKLLSQHFVTNGLGLIFGDVDVLFRAGVQKWSNLFYRRESFPAPEFDRMYDIGCDKHNNTCVRILFKTHAKMEVWKVPDVCEHFLGNGLATQGLKKHLKGIHSQCKNTEPDSRPTFRQILFAYVEELVGQNLDRYYNDENPVFHKIQFPHTKVPEIQN